MKNFVKKTGVSLFLVTIIIGIGTPLFPTSVQAADCPDGMVPFKEGCRPDTKANFGIGDIVNIPAKWIAGAVGWMAVQLLGLSSLFVYLSGLILNAVIKYTVVDMSANLSGSGNVINKGWTFIRDIGNMTFIFILLYASIRTIVGAEKGAQALIVKMVVVGVLVNFSLFFTKLVIDLSNSLAMTFYDAISPGSLNSSLSLGLSTTLMAPLQLQSIWQISDGFDGYSILAIGVMGTIFTLITAFVFMAISMMFVIRFVVLIFVLILSPIAFFSYVLPNTKQYSDQWMQALTGQAFFAPIYFILTWIVVLFSNNMTALMPGEKRLTIAEAVFGITEAGVKHANTGAIGSVVNFIILIALLITSLVAAKRFSGQGGVGKLTNWATDQAANMTFDMAGKIGRNTVGAAASRLALSEGFQRYAARSPIGQFALNRTNKVARSSFDLRNTRAGSAALSSVGSTGEAQKGGFEAELKEKIENREKFAQTLRSPDSKTAYATRVASGVLTRGGSANSENSMLGVLGRHNRVFASKLLSERINKLRTDLNAGNTELTRYQNIMRGGGTLNPTQAARESLLSGPLTRPGSLLHMQDQITSIEGQIESMGLTSLTPTEVAANAAARTAGTTPLPHKGRRADEQNY